MAEGMRAGEMTLTPVDDSNGQPSQNTTEEFTLVMWKTELAV